MTYDSTHNTNEKTAMLDTPLTITTSKLDADQYSAVDLDGATESVFGSGNMAYASLQASQTDALLNIDHNNAPTAHDIFTLNTILPTNTSNPSAPFIQDTQNDAAPKQNLGTNTDRPTDNNTDLNNAQTSNTGNFTSGTVGSLSASQLSADAGSFAPASSGLSLNSAPNNDTSTSDEATPDSKTEDTHDDHHTHDHYEITNYTQNIITINNGDTVFNIDLGDITTSIDNVLVNLGDTITTLNIAINQTTTTLNTTINAIEIDNTLNLTQIDATVLEITENLDQTAIDTLNEIMQDTGEIAQIITPLTDNNIDITNNIDVTINDFTGANLTNNALTTLTQTTQSLTTSITQATQNLLNTDIGGPATAIADTLSVLQMLTNLINDQIDTALTETLEDLNINDALTDIADTSDSGDSIIETATQNLDDNVQDTTNDTIADTIETITGDIDIDTNADINTLDENTITNEAGLALEETPDNIIDTAIGTVNTLNDSLTSDDNNGNDSDITVETDTDLLDHDIIDTAVEAVIDPIEDIVGDIDIDATATNDILNPQETNNQDGDTDITASADIDLIDNDLTNETIKVEIDPVEAITGDVDIDANAALNILGDTADPTVNEGQGGTGQDTITSEIGDTLTETVDSILPDSHNQTTNDFDLTVETDINTVDENLAQTDNQTTLDPIEELTSDIDIAAKTSTDLLSESNDPHCETDEGETGESGDQSSGDTDIQIDIASLDIDINLDPVEDITGDIDLDIDTAIDVLDNNIPEGESHTLSNDNDNSWTENTITDGGGLFGDLTGAGAGLGDALPDPAGTVGEGLGALDVEPDIDVSSLGGLFG